MMDMEVYDMVCIRDGANHVSILSVMPANLLDHHIYLISIFHIQLFRSLVLMETLAIEQKSDIVGFELQITMNIRIDVDNKHPLTSSTASYS